MRRSGIHIGLLLGVCAALGGAPPRNAAPGVKYVGSKVCAACHYEIYKSYVKTAMGRSVAPATPDFVTEPVTVHSDALNRDFRVYREGDAIFQAESESRDGQLVFQNRLRIEYVIGSGENGMSFVVRRGDHLFQAPLSFYSRTKKWDLSPGYEHADFGFTRPIYDACITCHAGRPQPVPGRDGLFRTPEFEELAVGCENCHGPGEIHVREQGQRRRGTINASIVNPAKLAPPLAEDICMKCHQGGDARVLLPGKNYSDIRPGVPLVDTLAIVSLPLTNANSDLLEHHVSMKLSACYRKSSGKLSCLNCHNPHHEPAGAEATAFYRSRCLTCHNERSCTAPAAVRAANGDNCTGCHMPKRGVAQISHSALTNHRIPRRPNDSPSTFEMPEAKVAELPGLLLLNAATSHTPLPFPTRLSAYGELSGRSPELLLRYLALLDEAATRAPDDPQVLAARGRRSLLDRRPDAVELLTRAVDKGALSAATLIDLSEALEQAGQPRESIKILERACGLFPLSKDVRKRLILEYIQARQYSEARESMKEYMRDFPEDDFMRDLLRRVTGN
jgi:predicted CXXCH cytochrome family protein